MGLSRACALVLGLLALTIQTFTVQTHVHGFGPHAGGVPGATLALADLAPDQLSAVGGNPHDAPPDTSDQTGCPLCQSYVAAGLAILPWIISLIGAAQSFLPIAANPATRDLAPSHFWLSRGPPLAV